jgi:hypothetical protein
MLVAFLLAGCGFVPKTVSVNDHRIEPLWNAARSFDRAKYGFSPLPQSGTVGWEYRPRANYDAMLHIYRKTSRTIAFRKTSSGFRWIGEQEIFQGPKTFKTPDGDEKEQIVLDYNVEAVSGTPLNRLVIQYDGEDRRLSRGYDSLTLNDVAPILKEWGY